MPKLVIIKTGCTLPELSARRGDFEDWVLAGLGISPDQTLVVDVCRGGSLPDLADTTGVVITGSHSMVTDLLDWSECTAAWLSGAAHHELPILGICYGHQLLAHALGGQVKDNPSGLEIGTLEVTLTEDAKEDPLLSGLPSPLFLQLSHAQSVVRLPESAQRLAYSERESNQAFRWGKRAWGVQFHPEFDAEVIRSYLAVDEEILTAAGRDSAQLAAAVTDTPWGTMILRRFANLCGY